jgi:hypothetical protein
MHICTPMTTCKKDSWQRLHKVNCTVDEHVVCLGNRFFHKRVKCNWTSGYKWSVAMILSVLFGGFGVDRFYLGLYKAIFCYKNSNNYFVKKSLKYNLFEGIFLILISGRSW